VRTKFEPCSATVSLNLPAEEQRLARRPLREMTGDGSNEDLLRGIFIRCCIGK